MISETASRAIEAYGGEAYWNSHRFIEANVSAHGLAFTLKRRPIFDHAHVWMEINRPYSKLTPIGKTDAVTGVLENMNTRLEDCNGKVIESRTQANRYFTFGRRTLKWDDLDMAYFANYAFWNYFTLPKLLMNPTIQWTEIRPGVLDAQFPDDFPTHSKLQRFYFDQSTGLLHQHNYTVAIIHSLAKAANVVTEHHTRDGHMFAAIRKVTPQGREGHAMGGPLLIGITVHEFRLTNDQPS